MNFCWISCKSSFNRVRLAYVTSHPCNFVCPGVLLGILQGSWLGMYVVRVGVWHTVSWHLAFHPSTLLGSKYMHASHALLVSLLFILAASNSRRVGIRFGKTNSTCRLRAQVKTLSVGTCIGVGCMLPRGLRNFLGVGLVPMMWSSRLHRFAHISIVDTWRGLFQQI